MSDAPANFADLAPEQRLLAGATRFDFFQAVRILERAALNADTSADGTSARRAVAIGQDGPWDREPVRFHGMPSLSFPTAPIMSVTRHERPASEPDAPVVPLPADMVVTFMGLAGPNGVLPDHYTSQLIERVRYKDLGLHDFLDLFNHRLISLFYRAWEKYRFETAYERRRLEGKVADPAQAPTARPWDAADDFTSMLLSLVGLGTGGLQNRTSIQDETLVFYAGHFAHQARCATSLGLLLNDYFGMHVEIRQFVGQWLPLAEEDRTQVGRSFCSIGRDAVLGKRVWDVQSKFRVRVGPLTYDQYVQLLPGGIGLRKMFDMVRLYVGSEFDFDVQPLLKASEIPKCQAGRDPKNPDKVLGRLGRNFWLVSKPATEEFDGAVFTTAVT